jgi:iron complex transport system substrate-binding protein
MKKQYKITVIMIAAIVLGITSYSSLQNDFEDSIKKYETSLEITKAKYFKIYNDEQKIILVDGANRKIPLSYETDENSLQVPANRIIVFSSTHAAFMDRLGIADKIVGVTGGNSNDWYIDSVTSDLDSGRIKDVGLSTNPNYDQIVALDPDVVILTGGIGMWENHGKKLDELGIPFVVVSEWMEDDPLGKFEWIKVFSIITGTEDSAVDLFDIVSEKTKTIFEKVSESEKPQVLWAGVFKGTAYVPRDNSYVGEIIRLANADYIFKDFSGSGSAQISIEELLLRSNDADILVYSSDFVDTTSDITSIHPLLSELRPIQNCNVYSFQPWYWQSVDKYDDFANDVAAIMHPELFSDYQLKQFKKVSCV